MVHASQASPPFAPLDYTDYNGLINLMFAPNDKFVNIVPRLEPLHEGATPADLLILYFDPQELYFQAKRAVAEAEKTRDLIERGTELTGYWNARHAGAKEAGVTPIPETDDSERELTESSEMYTDGDFEKEFLQLFSEESGRFAEDIKSETDIYWERYPELAKEAEIARATLRRQTRLGLRRRLIHALAGMGVAAAVFVPPTYAGLEYINSQREDAAVSEEEGWRTKDKVTFPLISAGAISLGGLISFHTHGRSAGNRVARQRTIKRLGYPKYDRL